MQYSVLRLVRNFSDRARVGSFQEKEGSVSIDGSELSYACSNGFVIGETMRMVMRLTGRKAS